MWRTSGNVLKFRIDVILNIYSGTSYCCTCSDLSDEHGLQAFRTLPKAHKHQPCIFWQCRAYLVPLLMRDCKGGLQALSE